jgi:hypothetical protein
MEDRIGQTPVPSSSEMRVVSPRQEGGHRDRWPPHMTEGLWPEGVVEPRALDRRVLLIVGTDAIRRRELKEGLPYQSLIASILHKYVSRSAPQTN